MSDILTAEVRPGADPNRDTQRDFWLWHMRIAFGVFLGETLVVMVYLGLTPRGPHRPVLWIVEATWFALALANLMLVPSLASRSWRAQFTAAWTVLAAFAVGAVASLDGGLESPLILLLFLPVPYTVLVFTPWVVGVCGFATLASAAFVVTTDSSTRLSLGGVLVLFAVLAGASVLSIASSVNRTRRERREQLLVKELAKLAATDGLTGCAVHRVFYQRFEEEIARSVRNGHPLSLMMIDVDCFKSVNDTYGHSVGDDVLAAVGAALRAHARRFDLVGRLGGDEFAVLMPDTEPSAAGALAERIRRDAPATLKVPVTLTVGVSGLDRSAPTTKHMLDDADIALYQAKRAGRDGVAKRCSGPSVRKDHPEAKRVPTP